MALEWDEMDALMDESCRVQLKVDTRQAATHGSSTEFNVGADRTHVSFQRCSSVNSCLSQHGIHCQ